MPDEVLADLAAAGHEVHGARPARPPPAAPRRRGTRRAASRAPACRRPCSPTSSGPASLTTALSTGAFHGAIPATTPTGSRTTSASRERAGPPLLERDRARDVDERRDDAERAGGEHLRQRERQAHLGGDELRDLVGAREQGVVRREQDARALLEVEPRPRSLVEGGARRGDGRVHVGLGRERHAADGLLGRGRDHLERPVPARRRAPAADQEVVALGQAGHDSRI